MDRIFESPTAALTDEFEDLEGLLLTTRAAAEALAIVVERIIESRHPDSGGDGVARLLVDEGALDAAAFLMSDLLARTRDATESYQAAAARLRKK